MLDPLILQSLEEFIFQQLVFQEEGGLAFNWINVLDNTLQEQWNGRNLQNLSSPLYSPTNTPEHLLLILEIFLTQQPPLTRTFHQRMAAHFNLHRDKNTAMKDTYPNNHGDNQQPDSWESFILLCKDAMDRLVFITQKKMAAPIAFRSLTNLISDL